MEYLGQKMVFLAILFRPAGARIDKAISALYTYHKRRRRGGAGQRSGGCDEAGKREGDISACFAGHE